MSEILDAFGVPEFFAEALARVDRYGFFIILALLMIPGALNRLLSPIIGAALTLLSALTGN